MVKNEYLVERVENEEHRISVEIDPHCEDPREWENLGTMLCGHKRYDLGDVQADGGYGSWEEELDVYLTEQEWEDGVVLPLYLYDHSQLFMNTTGFSCSWDSGQVGWIYANWQDIVNWYDLDPDLSYEYGGGEEINEYKDKARKQLKNEVNLYDHYLRGELYGFVVERKDNCGECGTTHYELLDSCWGFIGSDGIGAILDTIREEFGDLDGLVDELADNL